MQDEKKAVIGVYNFLLFGKQYNISLFKGKNPIKNKSDGNREEKGEIREIFSFGAHNPDYKKEVY